jgi:predicted naringenin-chalcone synthase
MSRILSTATALPRYALDRATYKRYCEAKFAEHARAARHIIDHTRIDTRYLSRPPHELLIERSLEEKSADYAQHALALSEATAARALDRAHVARDEIDLMVTTSCTGVMIPSVDAYLVEKMGFRRDCIRLPITELGCAAGAAALSRAREHLVAYPNHVVLVIAVELPSLTYQPRDLSMTNLVATSLFGDGAAACVIGERAAARPSPVLIDSRTHLFPRSHHLMGFELKDGGFHIVLDREVPDALRGQVKPLVDSLLEAHGLALSDVGFAVIHPGGRRILEDLEKELGLGEMTRASWEVLRNYGNLSSATILFVLDEVIAHNQISAGEIGVLAAFGPGFSCELSLLRWDSDILAV